MAAGDRRVRCEGRDVVLACALGAAPLFAVLGCAGPAPASAPAHPSVGAEDTTWQTDLDRKVLEALTATRELGALVFHYRPGDLTPEQLEQDVAANVAYFHELQDKLAMEYVGRIHVFLYKDKADMRATTEGEADIAFSTGTVSVHQLHDFRGVHELTHIFALQFPGHPDGAGPDLFLTEGLATALAESDQGVAVDAWAAMYLRIGKLPELSALRGDFMGSAPQGVHPYHVAASFVKSLIDRFGIEKVKAYYENSTEAGMVFGVPLPRLERDWRAHLAALAVAPGDEAHVLARFAKDLPPLPAEWRTKPGVTLFGGDAGVHALDALVPDEASHWRLHDGLLVGEHDGPWSAIHSRERFGPDVGLRARFRLVSGNAVQLRLDRVPEAGETPGREGQAIFARWSAYLSAGEGFAGNEEVQVPEGVWCEAIFVAQAGRGRLYLNGLPVFDELGALPTEPGVVGIAVERGVIEVAELTVFEP